MDLFSYPASPGYKARDTARDAARDMAPKAPVLRAMILESMGKGYAWTPDKFAESRGLDKLAVRPRFSELAATGDIIDTGQRQSNASGKRAAVWCAPQFKSHYTKGEGNV